MRDGSALVAMSGGVDSSVAAAMLVRDGLQVIGATMKTFCYSDETGPAQKCCGLEGISDARAVAAALGMPHRVFDLEKEFTDDVIRDFVSEYAAGRTPIPCVRCNSFTKFRDLVRRADELGCDFVATGHYARVSRSEGSATLRRSADAHKDQTYFLWGIPRSVLDRLLLPVGDLEKDRVREVARSLGLVTAEKPESFEICFVPNDDYASVLEDHLGERHPALSPGPIVLEDGAEAGRHDGYARFTVGQRKRLPGGFAEPMFVLEIQPETQTVVIGPRTSLSVCGLTAESANWLTDPPASGERVGVRIRHGAPIVEATLTEVNEVRFSLELRLAQHAVTPGQSAVLYRDDVVLGGGVITRSARV
ncbi:MAG: tRNA 2-thiouridine(34) synthase MnmA [marine benthic group bacterium]|nr:tRNA 2-thiouridine(34) synthase MnmA [Candidatus Benthicola marisminoris]